MSARDDVLGRIRTAVGDAAAGDEYAGVAREYATTRELPTAALLDLLAERVDDYRATVRRTDPQGVPAVVASALRERGARIVVPPGLPEEWLAAVDGVEIVTDDGGLNATELDGIDGVVTGCAVAIAETGTLVLDGSPGQGRRALTLVPDYHLCVVRAADVVPSVPQALARLDPTRPLTFVSGPSATSDIELNRVEGVHGPRTLDVVIVG